MVHLPCRTTRTTEQHRPVRYTGRTNGAGPGEPGALTDPAGRLRARGAEQIRAEQIRAELPGAGSGTRRQVTEYRLHKAVTADRARDEQRRRGPPRPKSPGRRSRSTPGLSPVAQHSRAESAALVAATASVPFAPVPAVPLLGLVRPPRLGSASCPASRARALLRYSSSTCPFSGAALSSAAISTSKV
ncbi:hypothetical protein ADL21_20630 [Streptomyces albus subsp. albus]|nr:hypothetical protein ADL21_20630 [Streptomyces albus subsp. albus]